MTRVLSELLGASEPTFHLGLSRLERISGRPSHDIRLSAEVAHGVRAKLRALGLDPKDTTGPELYEALKERVRADDARLIGALKAKYQADSADMDLMANIARALQSVPIPRSCFALKPVAAKAILRKFPPKKTMKRLGYRSLDSMLKHESVAGLYAAAWLIEAASWRKNVVDQYKNLRSTDFEVKEVMVVHPTSKRWQTLADDLVARKKHNVISFKELGAVVLLPLPAYRPPVVATTTLLLALHAINEIRAAGTFLKLCQVKPDFGRIVQAVVTDDPVLTAHMLDQPVQWQIIQRYYSRFAEAFKPEIFEPHVQREDLSWHSLEKVLSHIEPSLAFWHHTTHLSLLHEHQPVSFNIIDVALSQCNQLPYARRMVHYFRYSLWHELLIRYLKHDNVEHAVLSGLQSELVQEPELV